MSSGAFEGRVTGLVPKELKILNNVPCSKSDLELSLLSPVSPFSLLVSIQSVKGADLNTTVGSIL
jgi:hypothetical protein